MIENGHVGTVGYTVDPPSPLRLHEPNFKRGSFPRANGAKRRARVLIPFGFLHPGKGKH